jgi:hypothetical protein
MVKQPVPSTQNLVCRYSWWRVSILFIRLMDINLCCSSCFIAMTYETPGSSAFEDPSNWKNVYTISGSCPATTAGGLDTVSIIDHYNVGPQCSQSNSNQTDCVHSYTIPIPDNLKDGEATFAWVWLSKITPETYMNCAPITVSGAKDNGQFNNLPNLQGMSFTGLTGGGPPEGSSSTTSAGVSSHSSSSSSFGSSFAAHAPSFKTTSDSGFVSNDTMPISSVTSPGRITSISSSCSGGPCSTNGAIQCNSTTWSLCSNGCRINMGSVGGLTCSENELNKRMSYKVFQA